VISGSLNPQSRSRVLAQVACRALEPLEASVDWLDLAKTPLPLCDGDKVYEDPQVIQIADRIKQVDGILIAVPIYNYDINAAVKNLIELTGSAWSHKIVGFLCAAGGEASYMSVMNISNGLMLDFRCLIVPRFVYATGAAFGEEGLTDAKVRNRIEQLVKELHHISSALSGRES
jgi:FMN reductase